MAPNFIRRLAAEVDEQGGKKRTTKINMDVIVLQEDLPHHSIAGALVLEEEDSPLCPVKK